MMRKYFVTFSEKNLTGNAGLVHLGRFAERLGIGEMLRKIFLPLSQENAEIVGVTKEPLPHLVQAVVERIKEKMNDV